jgi:hypothetical protein
MEVSGQLHAPAALLQGKSPWYPLDRKLCWSQSLSGGGGEEKNSQPVLGLETPIIQPVIPCYTTEISWLLPQSRFTKYQQMKGSLSSYRQIPNVEKFGILESRSSAL